MITFYDQYIQTPRSLTFEEMQTLQKEIIEEIGTDEGAKELYQDLLEVSRRYVDFRSKWLLLDQKGRMEIDSSRTSCHNSVISHFNRLSNYLTGIGKECAWREELGYEADNRYNRCRIGDFACFLTFINCLNAR